MDVYIRLLSRFGLRFLRGTGVTISVSALAVLGGVVLGTILTLLYRSRFRIVRFFAATYRNIIRGTPLYLQLLFFYVALDPVVQVFIPNFSISKYAAVTIAMVLNSGAYVSEIIRSGIQAVDKGQEEAARSLGLSSKQTMSKIILPQAIKNILPALGNEFVMIIKETALSASLMLGDIMTVQAEVKGITYQVIPSLVIAAVIYFILTTTASKLVGLMERKLSASD